MRAVAPSLNQMAGLFGRDKSVISKHLKSIFEDGELALYEFFGAGGGGVQPLSFQVF